jgi:RNA recognition motif-containing protein
MKLRVLGLPKAMEEETLEGLFAAHGSVASCSLVMDDNTGVSKGFGFVEMPNDTEATAAIAALNGSKQSSHRIRVKAAQEEE